MGLSFEASNRIDPMDASLKANSMHPDKTAGRTVQCRRMVEPVTAGFAVWLNFAVVRRRVSESQSRHHATTRFDPEPLHHFKYVDCPVLAYGRRHRERLPGLVRLDPTVAAAVWPSPGGSMNDCPRHEFAQIAIYEFTRRIWTELLRQLFDVPVYSAVDQPPHIGSHSRKPAGIGQIMEPHFRLPDPAKIRCPCF
jgi:hypothetical protein